LRKVAAQIRDQPEDHLLTPKNSVLVIIDQTVQSQPRIEDLFQA
jgi:hypothetical protein